MLKFWLENSYAFMNTYTCISLILYRNYANAVSME